MSAPVHTSNDAGVAGAEYHRAESSPSSPALAQRTLLQPQQPMAAEEDSCGLLLAAPHAPAQQSLHWTPGAERRSLLSPGETPGGGPGRSINAAVGVPKGKNGVQFSALHARTPSRSVSSRLRSVLPATSPAATAVAAAAAPCAMAKCPSTAAANASGDDSDPDDEDGVKGGAANPADDANGGTGKENTKAGTCACCLPVQRCGRRVGRGCTGFFGSFVGVLVVSSALSLSLACIILIYLWYATSHATISSLSGDMRSAIVQSLATQIESRMAVPLLVATHIEALVEAKAPDLARLSLLRHASPYLADASLMTHLYDDLATVGCGSATGITFGAHHRARSVPQARPDAGTIYILSPPNVVGQSPVNNTLSFFQLSTHNPPSPETLPDFPAAPGLRNLSDEQLALLQAKLGTPITRLRNYNVRARPFYQRGLAIAALGRYSGWTPPAGVVATGVLSLTAVRASVARQPNGEPSFICFASILNESIDAILKRFNIGTHGRAFVFASDGALIATTLSFSDAERSAISIFSPATREMRVMAPILIERGFARRNVTEPSLGGQRTTVPPFEVYHQLGDKRYNMRALQLDIPALDWLLVLCTVDSDFDGGLASATRATIALSVVVIFVSVVVTALLARLLTQPLQRVTTLLDAAVGAIGMEKGKRQRRALRRLNEDFARATGHKVEETLPGGGGGGGGVAAAGGAAAVAGQPDVPSITTTLAGPGSHALGLPGGSPGASTGPAEADGKGTATSTSAPAARVSRDSGVEMLSVRGASAPPSSSATYSGAGVDLEAGGAKGTVVSYVDGRTMGREASERADQPQGWYARIFCCCRRTPAAVVARSSSRVVRDAPGGGAGRARSSRGCCPNGGLQLSEVKLMHRSIGSILHALSSSDMLEHINQAKRAFIRYVFHEVRVPFNAIVLGTEQLQLHAEQVGGPLGAEMRELTLLVAEQAKVVARILNDVLSMQKIEDGGLTLSAEAFDLNSLVRLTVASFREALQAKSLTMHTLPSPFTLEIGEALPPGARAMVWGDKYRLRQVIANFISNAIAFSPPFGVLHVRIAQSELTLLNAAAPDGSRSAGGGASTLSLPSNHSGTGSGNGNEHAIGSRKHGSQHASNTDGSSSNGGRGGASPAVGAGLGAAGAAAAGTVIGQALFRVSVQDQGPGIPLAQQGKIFNVYEQVQSARIQQGRGTGLGLQISRSIIELHGGRIGFVSEGVAGRGTNFYFDIQLPIVLVDTHEEDDEEAEAARGAEASLVGRGGDAMAAGQPIDDDEVLAPRIHDRSNTTATAAALRLQMLERGAANGHGGQRLSSGSRRRSSRSKESSEVPSVHFHEADFNLEVAVYAELHRADAHGGFGAGERAADDDHLEAASAAPQASPSVVPLVLPPAMLGSHDSSSTSSAGPLGSPASDIRKPRVLVVEDSAPNRKLLMSLLSLLQCSVLGAENGRVAVDFFADAIENGQAEPFDLVLMDGSMPVMSGLEATAHLRAHGIKVPVLAVTGNALQEDVTSFLAAGAQHVLTKPIAKDALIAALQRFLPPHLAALVCMSKKGGAGGAAEAAKRAAAAAAAAAKAGPIASPSAAPYASTPSSPPM